MNLKNKNIIITGSTRGIGKELAISCLKNEANVIIHGTNEERVNTLVTELKQQYKSKIYGFACDISNNEECLNFLKNSIESLEKIDILINNAGITADNLLLRMKEDQWTNVINTNLNSVFFLTKGISRHFLKNKTGKIINISSVVGVMGNAGQSNYAASKAGIIGFTKSVAKELGPKGITCNAVAPGFISTDMIKSLPDDYINNIIDSIPIKRLGTTDDVSNIVMFLASDNANYITGQTISVDGGMNM